MCVCFMFYHGFKRCFLLFPGGLFGWSMVHLYFVSRPRWDGAGDLDGKHGSDGGWADDDDDYGYQWLLYNGYIMAINDY